MPEEIESEQQMERESVINAFVIDNRKWKTLTEEKPNSEVPVWLKLENGNVVLAAHANQKGHSAFWKVFFSNGQFMRSGKEAFIVKGAKWQSCGLFKLAD